MSINTRLSSSGHEATISISGRFDFSQHQDFRSAFDKAPAAIKQFVVDLRATEYVDSSALGMLLVLRDKVGDQRDNVKIINANASVRKILEIANFDKLFSVV